MDKTTTAHNEDLRRTGRRAARHGTVVDHALLEATVPRNADGSVAVDARVWELHLLWHHSRSRAAHDALFEEYRGLATATAQRFYRGGADRDDLRQVAFEGLAVALERFDPARSIPFVGYALPTIVGTLKHHFREVGWSLRVSRRVHDLASPMQRAVDELSAMLGRPPTATELAATLDIGVDELLEVQEALAARRLSSLDQPVGDGGGTLADRVSGLQESLDGVTDELSLVEALRSLDDRQRAVLGEYFIRDRTQREIAAQHGVSQMQISRWISAAVQQLRVEIVAPERGPAGG